MPKDVLETLLTGAFATEAVLFGILGIFYVVHQTHSAQALAGQISKERPPLCEHLRRLSRCVAVVSILPLISAAFCFWQLTICDATQIATASPLALSFVAMVAAGSILAFGLMD